MRRESEQDTLRVAALYRALLAATRDYLVIRTTCTPSSFTAKVTYAESSSAYSYHRLGYGRSLIIFDICNFPRRCAPFIFQLL